VERERTITSGKQRFFLAPNSIAFAFLIGLLVCEYLQPNINMSVFLLLAMLAVTVINQPNTN